MRSRLRLALVLLLAALALTGLGQLPAWQSLEAPWEDFSFRYAAGSGPVGPLVVEVDEASLQRLKLGWPVPRTVEAELLGTLLGSGARLVVVDLLFLEPTGSDPELAHSLTDRVVLGGELVTSSVDGQELVTYRPPRFPVSSGAVNLRLDPDGVFRSLTGSPLAPTLVEAAASRLASPATLPVRVDFSRPLVTVPLAEVLSGGADPALFKDRVVLVGLRLPSEHDELLTPVGVMPGVEVQARALSTALEGPRPRRAGPVLDFLLASALLLAGAGLARLGLWRSLLAGVLLAGLLRLASGELFLHTRLLVPWLAPLLALLGGLACAGPLARRLGLSPGMAGLTLDQAVALKFEVEKLIDSFGRELTLLDVDVVGSTRLKLDQDPASIAHSFSEYHRYVAEVVRTHHGSVLNAIGDECMCVFPRAADALSACRAMLEGMAAFNHERNRLQQPFGLRVGINSGSVLYEQRTSRAIGQALDLAGHLQKEAADGSFLVSETAFEAMGRPAELVRLRFLERDGLWAYGPELLP